MSEKKNIESILAERMKLDELLKTDFMKKITVMFTDIKGSTSFYEQRGDLDGRLMVHRHNELVMPQIAANNGVLIKTIGDATMSVYDDPADGVRAAQQIQLKLKEHNKNSAVGEQIHVRIGLNTGLGIVEEKDVFGDVVNVAARVESLADGGEIMVTEDTYREVKSHDEFIFRFAKASQVRGKKEALKAYRLVWHAEDLNLGVTRSAPAAHQTKEGVFVLDGSVSGNNLKVSAYERKDGEERAVKNYKESPYQEDKVREYTRDIISVLNRANRRGKIGNDLFLKLKELGGMLYDQLIPFEIKELLKKATVDSLMLAMDDRLVHVPWELLYDGKSFLCQRFSVGRSVSTKQSVSAAIRALHRPLKMQILADPRGDLKAAYEEGVAIKNEVNCYEDWLNVSLKTTEITPDYIKGKMRNFDIVHYAGHAEHNADNPEESGWLLKNGKLSAREVMAMAGSLPMPALVFSNACQTGQTDTWKLDEGYGDNIFGMANAFLLSGVQHYIGTFWEIPDEAGAIFARSFYRSLADGATIGESVKIARHALIEKYGEDTIVWASYMLYGDPTTRYAVQELAEQLAEAREIKSAYEQLATMELRGSADAVAVKQGGKNRNLLIAASIALVTSGLLAFLFFVNGSGPWGNSTASVTAGQPAVSLSDHVRQVAESGKRIDALVATLAAQYREGKIDKPKSPSDEWSSKPVTMVFMDVKAVDAGGDAAVNMLLNRVAQELQAEGKVQLVERELLARLLEELQISSSALADPSVALKIGKLLSARIMVTGGIFPEKKGMTIMLRFIDTETSAVRKVVNVDVPGTIIDRETAQTMSKGISDWVKSEFPLRGRVVNMSGDTCMINLGRSHGLNKGDRLEIVKESNKGSGFYAACGEVEITEVEKDRSQARIVSTMEAVAEGAQVRMKI